MTYNGSLTLAGFCMGEYRDFVLDTDTISTTNILTSNNM